MTGRPSNIAAQQFPLADLIAQIATSGAIRIPRFQRDYVWERKLVAKLFDSIRREFPIGSFFFWITPREFRNLYKQIPELQLPEPADYEQIKMILDGQQRVTSLFVAAKGLSISQNGKAKKDYKKICFDLDDKEFSARYVEDKIKTVAVWRFFDDEGFMKVYNGLTNERQRSFMDCKLTLCNYPLSIVEVKNTSLDEAVLIFERINQSGKRLTLFDLVVANTWSSDFDLKEAVKEVNTKLINSGFGKVEEEIFAQALALAIKDGCTSADQLKLENAEIEGQWKAVAEGVKLAVDFLRANLGVRVADFIPYPSMLALMGALFARKSDRALNAEQSSFVKDWFWKASFGQRYAKSLLTNMGEDWTKYFKPAARGQVVPWAQKPNIGEGDLSNLKIYTRSAIKNAVFCLLALKAPRHFRNGTPIILDYSICSSYNDRHKHHIFPNAFLKQRHATNRHLLLNFTFLPKEINQFISNKSPSTYFPLFQSENPKFEETLESHFIPSGTESGIWNDDYDKFLKDRIALLLREIARVTGQVTPEQQELEDHPDSAINHVEKDLRAYIDRVLQLGANGDYWQLIPPDIRDGVNRRLQEQGKRQPYRNAHQINNRDRLDYLDLSDYSKIILKNWGLFEAQFGSKGDVERHFLDLKEFRNVIKHGRKLDTVIRKHGEASAEWLRRVLSAAGNG